MKTRLHKEHSNSFFDREPLFLLKSKEDLFFDVLISASSSSAAWSLVGLFKSFFNMPLSRNDEKIFELQYCGGQDWRRVQKSRAIANQETLSSLSVFQTSNLTYLEKSWMPVPDTFLSAS